MAKELTYEEKMALAAEASRLLSPDSLFNAIVTRLVTEYTNELIQAEVGGLTATAAHASMKALNDIKGRIRMIENDATMAKHRGNK